MDSELDSSESAFGVAERTKIKAPEKFKVVMYNDDYTTKDFVVNVLCSIFHKTENEAILIMESIHHTGKGIAGIYYYDIAISKAKKTVSLARKNGFPLKCEIEEV